jgi:serine protease Do
MNMKTICRPNTNRLLLLLLGGAVAAAGSALAVSRLAAIESKSGDPPMNVVVDENPVSRSASPHGSFSPVVKKVAPAVVKIVTTATTKNTGMHQWPGFDDPFWRRFFGDQFGPLQPPQQTIPRLEHGLGSGVIVTKDGYVLTNNHVVDGAETVQVTLTDGREFTAKVIGRDPKSDIAVVKIDASNLPIVTMADSDKVQVGDIVLAVGNPFGVGQTVTTGIVSATGRGNMGFEDYEDFIQTDAAINPGNSGGALVDAEGRLIGINTAILSRSGGNQGIGFAIPSDLAHNVMTSLVEYGHVTRGYLGAVIQDVTPALAKEFKLKEAKGALVGDVVQNGPADKAGLKEGDVVLEFDGKQVADSRHLKLAVAETKPGSTIPVKVLRDGSTKTLEVTVKQLPGTEQLAKADTQNAGETGTLNGVGVEDLNGQVRQQFNVPDSIKGAVVTEVRPDSAAAEAGLKPGDVIEEINRHPVANADQAVQLTEKAKDKHTLLRIWSSGGSHYVVVDESQTG